MIYVLLSVSWESIKNEAVTADPQQILETINDLQNETDNFAIEIWENNKLIKEEVFKNKSDDDLIQSVKNFINHSASI